MSLLQLGHALGVAICVLASATDLRSRRIPNALTYPGVLVLLGIAAASGPVPLRSALVGSTVAFASFFLLSHLRLFGMGDAKLMACVGAALGWPLAFGALAYTLLAGAVVAIGYGAIHGRLRGVIANLARPERLKARLGPNTQLHRMPYALAILLGMIYALLTHYAGWPGLRAIA